MEDSVNLLDGLGIDLDIPLAPDGLSAQHAPEFFGPYQLIQEVGHGGVARVLRARHIHPGYADTTFAIKILHDDLSRDPNVVTLFRHEAYVLSLLEHPNVVQTFEAGVQDDRLFIAMEYIDGRDLDNMLSRVWRANLDVPIPVWLHFVGEVLKGLTYAHELEDGDGRRLDLLHRDVNPANVFLSYDGRVKLGDFGVASIAAGQVEKHRQLAGKIGYFAPEQLEGKPVDQRADLFAVGVMMFEMLCRERLFEADTADKAMALNRKAKIPKPTKLNPEISPQLEALMLRALEKKPSDRYESARAMYADLEPFLPGGKAMTLAVASLMRKVFSQEHVQELQLREGLLGTSAVRGTGQLVGVYSPDERARVAFRDLLTSRGFKALACGTFEEVAAFVGGEHAPDGLLVDVSGAFDAERFGQLLVASNSKVAVDAFAERMTPEHLQRASDVGAIDFIFKPYNPERVLASVRAVMAGAVALAAPAEVGHEAKGAAPMLGDTRVLVVSQDPALTVQLSHELARAGALVDVSPTVDEALMRFDYSSYHLTIYDAHPWTPQAASFPRYMRARPGIGILPVMFLAEAGHLQELANIRNERCAAISRQELGAASFWDQIAWLRSDHNTSRVFKRYDADLPVELRYGGRVFRGETADISRIGMRLHCEQMPPINTEVSVSCRLPGMTTVVEVQARVVRVGVSKDNRAEIGVEFTAFASRGEAELILFLRRLDAEMAPPPLVRGAPPPAAPKATGS